MKVKFGYMDISVPGNMEGGVMDIFQTSINSSFCHRSVKNSFFNHLQQCEALANCERLKSHKLV